MALQIFFGSEKRAKSVAVSFDKFGNDALGGAVGKTVSEQVGNALVQGKKWGIFSAKIIDFLLGDGHCLSKATIPSIWIHYCSIEKVDLGMAKGCPCNWCGKTENIN